MAKSESIVTHVHPKQPKNSRWRGNFISYLIVESLLGYY